MNFGCSKTGIFIKENKNPIYRYGIICLEIYIGSIFFAVYCELKDIVWKRRLVQVDYISNWRHFCLNIALYDLFH